MSCICASKRHTKKKKEASENKRMEIVKPKRIKNGGKHVV